MLQLAVLVGTAGCSALATIVVRSIARSRALLDHPNERSAHVTPTPRVGGIAIMSTFAVVSSGAVILQGARAPVASVILGTAAVALLGLIDDLRPLRASWRFGVQSVVAAIVVGANYAHLEQAWTLVPLPAWLLAPLSVLWIVWLTNLYNFMDGIDGLAGGQAIIAGVSIACAAWIVGAGTVAMLSLTLVAATAGFLIFNFPPASIFMGDVGSTAIGFLFAAIPFASGSGAVPVEVVGIALALFILDATTTLVRRLMRGERFYQAHRSHWYQRPLACGVGHRTITLAAYAGMVLMGAAAAAYQMASLALRLQLVAAAVVVFLAYVAVVTGLERRHRARSTGAAPQA